MCGPPREKRKPDFVRERAVNKLLVHKPRTDQHLVRLHATSLRDGGRLPQEVRIDAVTRQERDGIRNRPLVCGGREWDDLTCYRHVIRRGEVGSLEATIRLAE
jgi:hypothetical protein